MEQLHFVKHESHRAALTSLLSELRADDDVCGLLVTGSVARGDALPESDVDVVVILRSGTPRHHALEEREGVPIEVSALDEASARSKMEESPSYLYAFLDGRILFDPEGGLKAL